jgi:hypothetical protein
MMVSKYFSLAEATHSATAAARGIDNRPDAGQLASIRQAAASLDVVREVLGRPIIVSSWYRSPALNRAVNGASTSAHLSGWAIDCNAQGMSALELCRRAVDSLRARNQSWDQIIHEHGRWMHISFEPRGRRQLLTIFDDPAKGYVSGLLSRQEYA